MPKNKTNQDHYILWDVDNIKHWTVVTGDNAAKTCIEDLKQKNVQSIRMFNTTPHTVDCN